LKERDEKMVVPTWLKKEGGELDSCLNEWEDAITHWASAADSAAQKETMLKAYESAKKVALVQGSKMSATMAEATVRSEKEWSDLYLECQKRNIKAERAKRILRLAEAKWETERSRQVSLRQLK